MTIDQFCTPTTYVKRILNACLLNGKPIDQSGALSSASGFHVLFSAKAICDHGSPRYDAVNGFRPKPFRRRRRVSRTEVNVCQARWSRLTRLPLLRCKPLYGVLIWILNRGSRFCRSKSGWGFLVVCPLFLDRCRGTDQNRSYGVSRNRRRLMGRRKAGGNMRSGNE